MGALHGRDPPGGGCDAAASHLPDLGHARSSEGLSDRRLQARDPAVAAPLAALCQARLFRQQALQSGESGPGDVRTGPDRLVSTRNSRLMSAKIRNLGPVSMQWMEAIDVHSLDDLRELGSVDAY